MFAKKKIVEIESLTVDPDLVPPTDERFQELLEECIAGTCPMYWAWIPTRFLIPSFPTFRPETKPTLISVIEALRIDIRNRRVSTIYTYSIGQWFVVSDDYPQMYAAMLENIPEVPSYILGEPINPRTRDLRRIPPDEVMIAIAGG
ncbi:MAG TPA: hypothetical protein PLX06_06950 [Fimbriimonadaceae bacterium]|nr:hypothetical protein [Fimbriimonadaceae bacterium]